MYCPSNRRQKCNAFVSKKWWILITLSQVCGTVSWPNSISVKEHQTAFWLEKKNPAKYCLPGKKKKKNHHFSCMQYYPLKLFRKKNIKNHGGMGREVEVVILDFFKVVLKCKSAGNKNYETWLCLPPKKKMLAYTDCDTEIKQQTITHS